MAQPVREPSVSCLRPGVSRRVGMTPLWNVVWCSKRLVAIKRQSPNRKRCRASRATALQDLAAVRAVRESGRRFRILFRGMVTVTA